MQNRLNLDPALAVRARQLASDIVESVQQFIEAHTTVSIERTILRLLGVDGVNKDGIPIPNVIVEQFLKANLLHDGVAYWLGAAIAGTGKSLEEVLDGLITGKFLLTSIKKNNSKINRDIINEAKKTLNRIKVNRATRSQMIQELGEGPIPWIYVIVATGNIYEDVVQAQTAALQGADIIAVIRSTAQSLLDYVPYGPTTEGYGGTFATQANFQIMRKALDETSREVKRYIRLTNYCSGLCMPEIAAIGALERLDMMLNDSMYGILFRDINMRRTFTDQYFSRMINAYAGVIINTGEDNYLTTADAYEEAHTVISSQFINERFALLAGLPEEQIGLGHAFEIDPDLQDGFLCELAGAQLIRELFPNHPLKYMPPTKHKTGNIFKGHLMDAMFGLVSILTKQHIHLIGVLTEAVHTPFIGDRYLSIENISYIRNNAKNLGDEIYFKDGGRIRERANEIIQQVITQLEKIKKIGLEKALENKAFAAISRHFDGGRGYDGVIAKSERYYNPFMELMKEDLLPKNTGPACSGIFDQQ